MTPPSHAPSTRLGACDPCHDGDHAGCWSILSPEADDDCTCYDDSWEWHEALGRRLDHVTIIDPTDLVDAALARLAEPLEDE